MYKIKISVNICLNEWLTYFEQLLQNIVSSKLKSHLNVSSIILKI